MADESTINEQLGLSKENIDQETELFHTVDPTLVDPQDTETSDIGFKGIAGIVNAVYDEDDTGGNADDPDLDISMINGMLYLNYVIPDPPIPSDRAKWIKHILNAKNTDQYKVWFLKSHEKNAYPFDTARGCMYWDFERELLFFIEVNKEDVYVSQKYPIAINVIGFDDVLNIEMYHNMRDENKKI